MKKVGSEELAKAVAFCLFEYGIKGKDLARKAQLTENQISKIKTKGRSNTDTLFAIANALLELNPDAARSFWTYLHGDL